VHLRVLLTSLRTSGRTVIAVGRFRRGGYLAVSVSLSRFLSAWPRAL